MIIIDADMLFWAMEGSGGCAEYYLDKRTGEILMISDETADMEEDADALEKLEADPDRYLFIDPMSSHEGFELMRAFVDDLPDSEAKTVLGKALSWKKPFGNFKDALCDYPELRERWYAFHASALRRRALAWLEEEGIDAVISNARATPGEAPE